ncbi:hypothetical protein N8I77_007794 [Diaporthe amygdali]|uniref:Transcription factor hoxa13 n=1 Tax=Phomopsis amygdali TaxID=1214568 RepID=A0AAD9SE03_PHOAM|nr:hypothetical protein N8I77_007794 [Diaporthe amygdali]KAK2604903.1 hypothetical protein N8I77_007794 [Diaporthe amygdali]
MEHVNGSVNGYAKTKNGLNGVNGMNGFSSSINSHTATPQRRSTPKPRPGRLSWFFSVLARLFTWYSILSILFRCPATLEECTDAAPRICKPYFQLKHAVSPHVEPYYNTYAAPYVELARPYYETVDQRVLTPSWAYATKHGAPRVAQAQAFGKEKWEKNLQPELAKYQALAQVKYDQTLAPHVNQVTSAVAPYYEVARTNALQTYHDYLLPSYIFVQPYAQQGYTAASTFTTETAIPSTIWAWNKTQVFLDGTVWPQLRSLYTENVEPQLLKIGQRLGRYNGNNTQKATDALSSTAAKAASTLTKPTSVASSASATPVSSDATTSSIEPSPSDVAPPSSQEAAAETAETAETAKTKFGAEQVPAPDVAPNESEVRRIARETVAEDLKAWQEKYAKAADEGAAEIDDRIEEIAKRMVDRQANTMGKSLVQQLKETVDTELATLKSGIQDIVSEVKSNSGSPEAAQEKVTAAVRKAGLEIKEKSQDIRNWRANYEREIEISVTKFAEDHFKILDSIRDLALQKIGMKWAWMDGVTYKDWAKYHLLKERFDEWQSELKNLITSHPGLESAQNEGLAIEGEAMELAQSAAKELASLKQVAGWKIIALDDSKEFDSEVTRLAAEEAEKAAAASEAESAVEDLVGTEDEAAASRLQHSASDAAEGVESVASVASESAESIVEEASTSVLPSSEDEAPEVEASSAILEETPVFVGNTTEATEAAQPDEPGTVHVPVDEVAEPVEADVSAVEEPEASSATATVKSAFLGAAAQSVPSRQPILEDDDSFEAAGSVISAMQSDIPATISSAASSAYSAALAGAAERYSQALSLVSAKVSGTPKPAHEQLLTSVTAAYSSAVAAASSQLDAALGAAQHGLFATTTTSALPTIPTLVDWAHVESIAAQRLNEGRAWAEAQYESAKIAIGAATPTPTDISGTVSSVASVAGESLSAVTAAAGQNAEKLLQNAQYNYYAGLGVAQARYSEFLAAASSAFSSMTATPTPTDLAGTISSVASVASESAASAASVAQENVSAAASVVGENASAAASVVGENVSSAAAAGYDNIAAGYENVAQAAEAAGTFAQESWNAVLDQVSVQIYGAATPTPWYEGLYSAAGDYVASATEAVGGNADAVTSAAGTYAASASEEASKQYVLVSSIVSELLVGKEPTFSESVYSRLAVAYSGAADSLNSFASVASETVASVATEAGEEVRKATQHVKDEL